MAQGLTSQKSRSVQASRFAMVPRNDVPRSAFDVQHTHKTTFDAGWLVPIFVDEVLPGDSIRVKMTAFARLATPIVPVMDNMYLESFFFFVPYRLVWENWKRFMGEQDDPTDSTIYQTPTIQVAFSACGTGSIYDYMGITMNGAASGSVFVSALPFRAYNLIYNEFFRDEDLQMPFTVFTNDGPDPDSTYFIMHRGKRHDYFTTCRPWPQKPANLQDSGTLNGPFVPGGDMRFPAAGAPVHGIGVAAGSSPTVGTLSVDEAGGRTVDYSPYYSTTALPFRLDADAFDYPNVRVLINDIRTANVVQLMMERNARGGTRYAEIVRSHFGVVSPDARLQRPEYLGGGRTSVTINPVAQTSASGLTGGSTVLGELAGVGTALASGHGFSQSFTEHGCILGLVQIRADLSYQSGINRMWFRRTQYDFYWPALANLGEQAVLSKEIYADGTAGDEDVFGYQERWSEYKFKPSRISGRFRSFAASSLDVWHLAQEFSARPVLNEVFIIDNPPVERVLQVEGGEFEEFMFDSFFDVRYVRPMPMYSIPGLGPRL